MTELKVDYPGLIKEKLPSGNYRYRVRVEGKPTKRIRLHIGPEHKDFSDHYRAGRAGIEIKPEANPVDNTIKGSISWLVARYTLWLGEQVDLGLYTKATLMQRQSLLSRLSDSYGNYKLDMPKSEIVQFRDTFASTPGAADNLVKAVRAMYAWALERHICDANPATGIGKINLQSNGAIPWTVDDLNAYRKIHHEGTTAHLCLTIFMFTACRISDAVLLGRSNEFERAGVRGLGWQPKKKGSAKVEIPMLPPLYKATRAATVQGSTYLLTEYGKPFESPEGLRNRFRKWCDEAGLRNRTSHGIRKAAGNLLAQAGCTQYQIMSIHGHTQAKTSEVYTKGVERWKLASDAMRTLETMEW